MTNRAQLESTESTRSRTSLRRSSRLSARWHRAIGIERCIPIATLAVAGLVAGAAGCTSSTARDNRDAAIANTGGASPSGSGGGAGGGVAGGTASGGAAATGGATSTGGVSPTGGATGEIPFDIYWIDVEGGAATLLRSPSGQSLLVDGGFPGNNDRDVNRVLRVLKDEAHLTRLDYAIVTHFHTDHVGGITALATRFPVNQFIDHGTSIEGGALYSDYIAAIAGKTRVNPSPGDKIAFGDVDIQVVTAAGEIVAPLPQATANPNCSDGATMPERPTDENPQSVGFVARYGAFDFVDLGDLTWAVELRLMCPTNRLGPADLLQVSHHGLELSSSPQLVRGLAPLVAVMNNGPAKGGAAVTFDTVKSTPGLQDLWSLHTVPANDAAHNADEALTANITASPDAANFLKASVYRSGAYTITNSRTGTVRTYQSR